MQELLKNTIGEVVNKEITKNEESDKAKKQKIRKELKM